MELILAVIFVIILWRVMLILGVPAPTAELVLLILLIVVVLGGGGLYIGTGHRPFLN